MQPANVDFTDSIESFQKEKMVMLWFTTLYIYLQGNNKTFLKSYNFVVKRNVEITLFMVFIFKR